VQDVIKNSQSPNIQVGQSIDVQRQGGVIRLPSGKTITRGAVDKSMPRVGGRYLLFLKYDQNTEDYSILMGYQLDGNSVYRLDDLKASDSTDPQVGHLLRSEGITESQFLTRVQASRDCQSG